MRCVALQATDLVQEAVDLHKLTGIPARGLGEALVGALLVGSFCRPGQRVNLNIQGDGFYKQALVDAYPEGTVRGYVVERAQAVESHETPPRGPWGSGVLSVLRTQLERGKQPYIGTVPLLTGHLAKDLSFYWVQSEQIPSAVGIAVEFEGNRVRSAGGFLVQVLPGARSEEVKLVEAHIGEMHHFVHSFAHDASPMNTIGQIFQSTPFMVLEEKPLKFSCDCSWERVERALLLVGAREIQAMLSEDEGAFVRCDFCAKDYEVRSHQLEELLKRSTKG